MALVLDFYYFRSLNSPSRRSELSLDKHSEFSKNECETPGETYFADFTFTTYFASILFYYYTPVQYAHVSIYYQSFIILMDSVYTPIVQSSSSYTLYPYRYVNLLLFLLAAAVNSLPVQTFASINSLIQTRFNYTPVVITLNILLGPITHPFMAAPCNWTLDKFGVRAGCTFGGIFVILGVWARTLMEVDNPFWAFAGSILTAIGNVFILSSPSAFAIKWFPNQSVPKIIAVAVLFNLLSSGTGASIAGLVLPQDASLDDIKDFFFWEAIAVTIPFGLFFILFRETPKSPPSRAAANKTSEQRRPYLQTVKNLLRNNQYLKIILSMSFSYGIFISFMSILDESLSTLQYKSPGQTTSTTIGCAMFMGTISAFMLTKAIRTTLKYKLIICSCLVGAIFTFTLLEFVFFFKIQSLVVVGVMSGCAGFFVIPLTALFTTYSAEQTYPTGQGSATGYLFAGSQTVGFISGMTWISILDKTNKQKVYYMFLTHTIFLILSLLVSLNTTQNLNKTKYELSSQSQLQSQPQTQPQLQSLRTNTNVEIGNSGSGIGQSK